MPSLENSVQSGAALLFPGIGAAHSGAECAFVADQSALFEAMYARAATAAGIPVSLESFLLDSFNDSLETHVQAYAFSCAVYHAVRKRLPATALTAGYSMGLYAAMYAAGALSYEDGVCMTVAAWKALQQAFSRRDFGMTALVGLREQECRDCIQSLRLETVLIVNNNSPICFTLAGRSDELERLEAEAARRDALKIERLPARFPYHHPLLYKARAAFAAAVEMLGWKSPSVPVVCGISANLFETAADLKRLAVRSLYSPVNWPGVMQSVSAAGVSFCFECGAGVTLTRYARFFDPAPHCMNLRTFCKVIAP